MASNTGVRPTVLVVDDEKDVADAHALKLRDSYDTRVAYGGEEALEKMDESVDAVLLDRRMPDVHGDEVLARIREEERYDCKVIMTTAVDPDLNILEMQFDDYLCKPIFKETLLETLETLVEPARSHDARLDEFFSLVSKLEVLEDQLSHRELEQSEEYAETKRRAEELGQELEEEMDDFEEIVGTFQDINRGSVSY